jgi:hypothetical protein
MSHEGYSDMIASVSSRTILPSARLNVINAPEYRAKRVVSTDVSNQLSAGNSSNVRFGLDVNPAYAAWMVTALSFVGLCLGILTAEVRASKARNKAARKAAEERRATEQQAEQSKKPQLDQK